MALVLDSNDVTHGLRFSVDITVPGIAGLVGSNMSFSKVSGLESESEVIEYREGNDPFVMRKIPGLTKFPPIVLERGVSSNAALILWREAIAGSGNALGLNIAGAGTGVLGLAPPVGTGAAGLLASSFIITMYNMAGDTVRRWTVASAWVSKLTYGDLDASSNEILIESVEIQHEGLLTTNF